MRAGRPVTVPEGLGRREVGDAAGRARGELDRVEHVEDRVRPLPGGARGDAVHDPGGVQEVAGGVARPVRGGPPPAGLAVSPLPQIVPPGAAAGGPLLLAVVIVGIVAATFGAALETALSSGYTLAQYLGWSWGKFRRPARAVRFHLTMVVALLLAGALLMPSGAPGAGSGGCGGVSAVALPLTYVPILLVANDPEYMGEHVNGRVTNALGMVYLVIVVVAAVAAIPLMIATGAGS